MPVPFAAVVEVVGPDVGPFPEPDGFVVVVVTDGFVVVVPGAGLVVVVPAGFVADGFVVVVVAAGFVVAFADGLADGEDGFVVDAGADVPASTAGPFAVVCVVFFVSSAAFCAAVARVSGIGGSSSFVACVICVSGSVCACAETDSAVSDVPALSSFLSHPVSANAPAASSTHDAAARTLRSVSFTRGISFRSSIGILHIPCPS